jgi:superfamily II DNA or RNA helicase
MENDHTQYKDLKIYLKNITEGNLRELIGQGICDAIVQYNLYINNLQVDYIEILENKFGKNILFEKNVFHKIIIFLNDKKVKEIADYNKIIYKDIDEAREKIINKSFGYRNFDFSMSIINILELDKDKYLPEQIELEDTFESKIKPNYHLHEYQKNLKDAVIQKLLNPSFTNRMLVHMPTGAGKTKTAMEIASDYLRCKPVLGGHEKNVFVVWLAHSKELCEQALETFQNTWRLRGDYEIDTYKLFGDADYSDEILNSERAFIFVGFQKFNAMLSSTNELQVKIKNKILQNIKLVIVDEAHKSLASTYEKAINLLSRTSAGVQLIGLTATPGRSSDQEDGQNNFLAEFFNSTKIGMIDNFGIPIENPISYLQDLEVLAKIERVELITDVQIKLSEQQIKNLKLYGDEKLGEILSNLAGNPGRNKIIIDKVRELFDNNESILIFACNVEHCIILQTLLKASGMDSGTILSSTSKFERETSITKFKSGELKVLINYGVLTTGFDAPRLNSLIIARPTSSIVLYSQMVGRALRGPKNGGNAINKLIDLRDNFDLGSESQMFNFYDEIWNN